MCLSTTSGSIGICVMNDVLRIPDDLSDPVPDKQEGRGSGPSQT